MLVEGLLLDNQAHQTSHYLQLRTFIGCLVRCTVLLLLLLLLLLHVLSNVVCQTECAVSVCPHIVNSCSICFRTRLVGGTRRNGSSPFSQGSAFPSAVTPAKREQRRDFLRSLNMSGVWDKVGLG